MRMRLVLWFSLLRWTMPHRVTFTAKRRCSVTVKLRSRAAELYVWRARVRGASWGGRRAGNGTRRRKSSARPPLHTCARTWPTGDASMSTCLPDRPFPTAPFRPPPSDCPFRLPFDGEESGNGNKNGHGCMNQREGDLYSCVVCVCVRKFVYELVLIWHACI